MNSHKIEKTSYSHRELMELTLDLAAKCPPLKRMQPKAAGVIVRDGRVLATAFRGQDCPSDHVEFALLNRSLANVDLAGSTMYLTLEPFAAESLSCTQMIIQRRIRRVFIATLNPDPAGRGLGELELQQAGVDIGRFDGDLARRFLQLNEAFTRLHPIEPSIRKGHSPQKSPGGHAVGFDREGNKIEYVPDSAEPSGYRAQLLQRALGEIERAYTYVKDLVSWQQYQVLLGVRLSLKDRTPQSESPELQALAREVRDVEQRLGLNRLLELDDYSIGLACGKLSALAWVRGGEWDIHEDVIARSLRDLRRR